MSDDMLDELSPDGRTLVQWSISDGRMSHIIRTPTIIDAAGGDVILRCADSGYDGSIVWGGDGLFELDFRHYWLPGGLRLGVDRNAGTFRVIDTEGEQPPHPLAELSAFVEGHFNAAARDAARNATGLTLEERLELQLRGGSRALWIILAIGVCVAIWFLFVRR